MNPTTPHGEQLLLRLLQSARDERVADDVRLETWARVSATIEAGSGAGRQGSPRLAVKVGLGVVVGLVMALPVAALFADVGPVPAPMVVPDSVPTIDPTVVQTQIPEVKPESMGASLRREPTPLRPEVEVKTAERPRRKRRRARSRSAAPDAGGPTPVTPKCDLATESDVARRALIANNRGAHRNALSILAKHRQRCPHPRLGAELEALRVVALCGLGDPTAAAMRKRLQRRWPNSVALTTVKKKCDGD